MLRVDQRCRCRPRVRPPRRARSRARRRCPAAADRPAGARRRQCSACRRSASISKPSTARRVAGRGRRAMCLLRDVVSQFGRHRTGQQPRRGFEHLHLEAEVRCGRRDLETDEAAAEHGQPAPGDQVRAQRLRIGTRCAARDVGQAVGNRRQPARPRAGREHQPGHRQDRSRLQPHATCRRGRCSTAGSAGCTRDAGLGIPGSARCGCRPPRCSFRKLFDSGGR